MGLEPIAGCPDKVLAVPPWAIGPIESVRGLKHTCADLTELRINILNWLFAKAIDQVRSGSKVVLSGVKANPARLDFLSGPCRPSADDTTSPAPRGA
jgi:hypothetical protein